MKKVLFKNSILLAVLLLLSQAVRFAVFLFNGVSFEGVETSDVIFSFLHGVRFDLYSVVICNLLFLLCSPFESLRKNFVFKGTFIVVNSFYLLLSLSDIGHFYAFNKRLDFSFLEIILSSPLHGVVGTIFSNPIQLLGLFVFPVVFYVGKVLYDLGFNYRSKLSCRSAALTCVMILVFCFVAIRGGLTTRPISMTHTMLYAKGNVQLGHLTSNSIFGLIRAKSSNKLIDHYASKANKVSEKTIEMVQTNAKDVAPPKNILIVFVESLSSYGFNKVDPFLKDFHKEHKSSSIFLDRLYSNGRLSMDALASTLLGTPSHFETHLFASRYANKSWPGLAHNLKEKYPHSAFIHAAPKGTQYFDIIASAAGFQKFYSIPDLYKTPIGQRAHWGSHDQFFYEKAIDILNSTPQGFFAVTFSVSSHYPFGLPPSEKSELISDVEENYFKAIRYALSQLRIFFQKASQQSWYKDTLFVITGDHSPTFTASWHKFLDERDKLPLFLFYPGSRIGELDTVGATQHLDISRTIFDLAKIKPKLWSPFEARSLFNTSSKRPDILLSDRDGFTVISQGEKAKHHLHQTENRDEDFMLNIKKRLHNYSWRLKKDSLKVPVR